MRCHTVVDSPVGPLTLVAEDGALVALSMGEEPAVDVGELDDGALAGIAGQLSAYFRGERRDFDVPLAPPGTPFQQRVWAELRAIPYGETRSYGELAVAIGRPTAARAVGMANARNPIGIVVPCHRVVGADGTLTGYAGGLARKEALLDLERAHAGATLIAQVRTTAERRIG